MPRQKISRRAWLAGILLLPPAVWGGVEAWNRISRPSRFAVIDEGVLYRSSRPTSRQLKVLKDDFGIKTLLIVRKGSGEGVPDEIEFARKNGLDVIHIPIESYGTIPEAQIAEFWRCIESARKPILIHCMAGRHRTGFLCALYRIERQGWSVDRALDELLSYGFDTGRHGDIVEQLRQYRPRRTLTSSPATSKEGATGS